MKHTLCTISYAMITVDPSLVCVKYEMGQKLAKFQQSVIILLPPQDELACGERWLCDNEYGS